MKHPQRTLVLKNYFFSSKHLGFLNRDREELDMVVRYPPEYSGLTMGEYTNEYIEWDIEMRNELQRQQIFGDQVSMCPNSRPSDGIETPDASESNSLGAGAELDYEFVTRLPTRIRRYTRPTQCSKNSRVDA